jgi:uncharacterized repeat protein (TIGR01451 family)
VGGITVTTTGAVAGIDVEKTAAQFFGADGVVVFTITATNTGSETLSAVTVTDPAALAVDPASDCERTIGELAPQETVSYQCTVTLTDVASPFENVVTVTGAFGEGGEVSDQDAVTVFPQVQASTVTTIASAAQTLPTTGADTADLALWGAALVALGLGLVTAGRLVAARRHR